MSSEKKDVSHKLSDKAKSLLLQQNQIRLSNEKFLDCCFLKAKEIMEKQKIAVPHRDTGLEKISVESTLPKFPCSDSIVCPESENVSEQSFANFLSSFNSNRKKNVTEVEKPKDVGLKSANDESKVLKEVNDEEDTVVKRPVTTFRTAREELHMQQNKPGANDNNSAKPRKRLGMRGCKGKFISPMISNTEITKPGTSKSEEWEAAGTDDRLKNIDAKMVELIKSEIMDCGPPIQWTDIAGLEGPKTAIQEAVVWPMLRPDIFTGLRRPPKGILLFGPPGTGKTLIGKCVAAQSKSTFFSISASSLTSKWVGDGEKMVRALFEVARCHQPAVIFIDEIDSLLSQRSETEHESSRRIKTEFLVQLDGATTDSEERLLVIGATNRPQELDEAARRRFVKRLYIPLPEFEARLQLVTKLMSTEKNDLVSENLREIASKSEGYSGADMRNLCADASMGPIRSIDMNLIQSIRTEHVRPINIEDFQKALNRVKSSVSPADLNQYVAWDNTYGSGSFKN